jgi:hypothetical protein
LKANNNIYLCTLFLKCKFGKQKKVRVLGNRPSRKKVRVRDRVIIKVQVWAIVFSLKKVWDWANVVQNWIIADPSTQLCAKFWAFWFVAVFVCLCMCDFFGCWKWSRIFRHRMCDFSRLPRNFKFTNQLWNCNIEIRTWGIRNFYYKNKECGVSFSWGRNEKLSHL